VAVEKNIDNHENDDDDDDAGLGSIAWKDDMSW